MSFELLRVRVPLGHRSEVILPGGVHLLQDPLRYFGRQRAILGGRLHELIEVAIADDTVVLVNIGLTFAVQRGIKEVFAGESCSVNGGKTWVMTVNAMLFDQLHPVAPYFHV